MATGFKILLYGFCLLASLSSSASDSGDSCTDSSGKEGVCKEIVECESVLTGVKQGIRPTNCGFNGHMPIVCCPKETSSASSNPDVNLIPRKPGDKALEWCYTYLQSCPDSLVGGDLAKAKEFPHMAALGYGPKDEINWSCGGTLVSEKFVLTAAHCMRLSGVGSVQWVLLATEVTRSVDQAPSPNARRGQTHPVIRRIRHPDYRSSAKYHDVALLEIGAALEPNSLSLTSSQLHPACLTINATEYPAKIIATGWGRVDFAGDTSPDLLKVEIDILDNSVCNNSYKVEIQTSALSKGIDNTMICAGVLAGGKDTCQGDSGGPLQVPTKYNCMYEIWGITSFGKICGQANSPAIYTRVSEYVPWIERIVWP